VATSFNPLGLTSSAGASLDSYLYTGSTPAAATSPAAAASPAASSGGFDLGDVGNLINNLSAAAAPWVSAFTGTTVIPLPTSSAQAAAQQLQLQQAAQAKLAATNPVLSGILANPTILVILAGIFLLIVGYFILKG